MVILNDLFIYFNYDVKQYLIITYATYSRTVGGGKTWLQLYHKPEEEEAEVAETGGKQTAVCLAV